MANLSASELRKYSWRPAVFIEKLEKGTPFELSGGKVDVLRPLIGMAKAKKILESGSNPELSALEFAGSLKGGKYKIVDVVKNKEFGGKGEGSGTAKEDKALAALQKQIEVIKKAEKKAVIPIKVGNKIFQAFGAESTNGTPKSDFHLVDIDGKEICWISHKDGKTEKDFAQWGGMSQSSEPAIYSHRESQSFIKDMQTLYPKGIPNATTVARKIKDNKLKMMSVYGNQYGGAFGQQNVNVCLQGDVLLTKSGSHYVLSAYHAHFNGDKLEGGFDPAFMCMYKGDRDSFGIKGARVVISPIGGRKITFMV